MGIGEVPDEWWSEMNQTIGRNVALRSSSVRVKRGCVVWRRSRQCLR